MASIVLEVQDRDPKVSPMYLRRMRKIPAIYYGKKEKSLVLQMDYQSFRKAYKKAGTNQIVELSLDGKKKPVLIHEVQFNPLSDDISHVDFLHVNMNEEVTAMIPVEIVGVAPAVKNFGGILTVLKHEIEVRCLPGDLPHSIQVDVSGLEQMHSSIHIKDLPAIKGVKIHGAPDDVVVNISQLKAVQEDTPPAPTAAETAAAAAPAEGAAPAAPAKKE